jgi:hypothetical protein
LLLILKEINQALPIGAITEDINIQMLRPLTPEIINKLNPKNSPGLINTKMQIKLKEIIYEK